MSYWRHIYATAADIYVATMCAYPPYQHALPHWKCVLPCCCNCLCIDLPDQESDKHYSNTSPPMSFHICHLIVQCTVHGRSPRDENKFCRLCFQYPATVIPAKLYTRK